jgi:hypothetical protein
MMPVYKTCAGCNKTKLNITARIEKIEHLCKQSTSYVSAYEREKMYTDRWLYSYCDRCAKEIRGC